MSTNKAQKWSSSSSLSKLFSRISRTLSFSSKKRQQKAKTLEQAKPTAKRVIAAPKSAPLVRRHPPRPISKLLYTENIMQQQMDYSKEQDSEDDDDDRYRYSLRPNLSLFNISVENLHHQSDDKSAQQVPLQHDWLDDIFHSTKIDGSWD